MKFGKRLQSHLEETLPQWRDKFLSYKQLKKRLKLITSFNSLPLAPASASPPQPLSAHVDACDHGVCLPPDDSRRGSVGHIDRAESTSAVAELHASEYFVSAADSGSSTVNGAGTVAEDATKSGSLASDVVKLREPKFHMWGNVLRNLSEEELDFLDLLDAELEKLNTFYVEKEEEYVIRLQEMKERIERVKEKSGPNRTLPSEFDLNEEMIEIRKDFVNFHGEMVLLENYSSLNYTGLVKILKKHDRRTGALLRMPFIQNVLHQPFFTTELLSKLVRECEASVQSLFPSFPSSGGATSDCSYQQYQDSAPKKEGIAAENQNLLFFHGEDVETIYRSTMAALRTMKEIRKGSSTYSVFSLPPYGRSDGEDSSVLVDNKTPCAAIPICSKK